MISDIMIKENIKENIKKNNNKNKKEPKIIVKKKKKEKYLIVHDLHKVLKKAVLLLSFPFLEFPI